MASLSNKETVNKLISHRNIELIGEYKNSGTKTLFKCHQNHTWLAKPNNVMNRKSGCPHCDGQFPLNNSIVNERLKNKNIQLLGEYSGIDTPVLFSCLTCSHNFYATPYNLMKKSFCPACHQRRGGFNSTKPGTFYILLLSDLNCIKYGISNNFKQRLASHKRSVTCEVLLTKEFNSGINAFLLEKTIKQQFGSSGVITEDQIGSGWTETLSIDALPFILTLV